MLGHIQGIHLEIFEDRSVLAVELRFCAISKVTFDLRDEKLGRKGISGVIDEKVRACIVDFLEVLLSLPVNFVVIIVLQLKELKNEVQVIVN